MVSKEHLFKELCTVIAQEDLHSDRFTKLWLATGVKLNGEELEIVNRLMTKNEDRDITKVIH